MNCYTRNFEDVMIQRVFSRIEKGTYIDVGASVPKPDSNTYALYQKGWQGVAIEPLPFYNDQWKEQRPRDILINAAVSNTEGNVILNIYEGAQQVSTCLPGIRDHWQRNANLKPDRAIEVKATTLNKIIEEHLPGKPIHLISIDAEGMEANVLAGVDLTKHRPWLMVIEATLPGTPLPSHQQWEPRLLDSGYLMVYFDGVNRFYLSAEQRNLLPAFTTPPNSWDNIEMVK